MKNIAFITVLLLRISGCSSENYIQSNHCDGKEFVKSIKSAKGTVYYNGSEYTIRSSHDNSYDSVDVGFLCEMADSLKKDGLKLQFSGSYYKYDGLEKPYFAGTTYYYLLLNNVTLIKD